MTDRPIKNLTNAGDEPLVVDLIVDGESLTLTIEPGESQNVPLSDDELAAQTEFEAERQAAAKDRGATDTMAEKPPLQRLVDELAALPPDKPVTAGDLLAAITGGS